MNRALLSFIYLCLFGLALGQTTYKVISSINNADTSMAVVVDDKPYPLIVTPESAMLHTGSAPTSQKGYYYAMIKKDEANTVLQHEPFVRSPVSDSTPNEFYNRSKNIHEINPIPQILDPLPSIHRIQSKLHPVNEIATIHIVGAQNEIDRMHNKIKEDIQVITNVTYISLDDVQTFAGVEFEISGRFSREAAKVSYNLKIPKKNALYGYRRLKLRSLGTDPSYIREDLGYRMLYAAGVPTTFSSYVRLYVNNEPLGLFGFIENFKNPWLRNEFADGNKDYDQGNLYQGKFTNFKSTILGNRVSDLDYEGEEEWKYNLGQYKIKEDPSVGVPSYKPLIALTKFIKEAPTTGTEAANEWNKHFDMESVLRGMALEMVMGFGDGYLAMSDNYYVYQEGANSTRFTFLLSDIDLSLGSTSLVKLSDLIDGDWRKFPGGIIKRPLMAKVLAVPEFEQRFNDLIKHYGDRLVNPDVLDRTIDDTVAMIKDDVAWDKTCKRMSKLSVISNVDLATVAKAFGFMKGYAVDDKTVRDYRKRAKENDISLETAVNGPTGYISLAGVKEFIANKHRSVASFYGA